MVGTLPFAADGVEDPASFVPEAKAGGRRCDNGVPKLEVELQFFKKHERVARE